MSNFWDIIWDIFYIFLFVAYLMVLFRIWIDIFSDHSLNGWVKAIWIIVLIFLPFLGALIYVIARGRGMAQRQMARIQQAQGQADEYIKQVASGKSSAQQIADAKALLDNGTVTQAEFDQLKQKALA